MIKDKRHPKIGLGDNDAMVFELNVYDFISKLEPPPEFDLAPFDPMNYFITSGDAIQKTIYMSEVLWEYAGKARKQLNKLSHKSKEAIQFEKSCWLQAGATNKLMRVLKEARGDAIFFETEWEESKIYLLKKWPRKRHPIVIK